MWNSDDLFFVGNNGFFFLVLYIFGMPKCMQQWVIWVSCYWPSLFSIFMPKFCQMSPTPAVHSNRLPLEKFLAVIIASGYLFSIICLSFFLASHHSCHNSPFIFLLLQLCRYSPCENKVSQKIHNFSGAWLCLTFLPVKGEFWPLFLVEGQVLGCGRVPIDNFYSNRLHKD